MHTVPSLISLLMKVGAIIAAAGFGRRMKADRPKQLLALNGIPIIIHTIRKFDISRVIDYIIVTAPRESVIEVSELIKAAGFSCLRPESSSAWYRYRRSARRRAPIRFYRRH